MFIKYPYKIHIYKVKPWCIYFKYEDKYYMVHTSSDGYEEDTTLYEKEINEKGNYKLKEIKCKYGGFDYDKYINNPYKFINKNEFIYNLTKRGLCYSIYSRSVKKREEKIIMLMRKINELQDKIKKL